ncbi:GMP reductase [Candidatus Dojkabacteria bacterium]|uniref:GMP reductase n=1 Tax=Candidatus Dojkabacteria bacterium TaxID=2099670 RepID=A0A955RKS6_9BACT|nr:GMP reductase [Candidatus Dojkabacteria bacterium]
MRIDNEIKLDFKDVLIRPKRTALSSRKDVDVTRTFTFLHSGKKWKGIPIVASNMDTTGTIEMARALYKDKLLTCLHKFYSVEDIISIKDKPFFKNIAITSGISDTDLKKLNVIVSKTKPDFICLDVANGYTETFVDAVKKVREHYPTTTLIAGNVVTGEMVEALTLAGADIVKIGIGPGSVCTTRRQTGVGYPQLSGIIECADAAHGLGGRIMADGGCTVPGDLGKAFGAGGDFVMLGGMFAGHSESGGDLVEEDGETFKVFYGMSSERAMKTHYGKVNSYRSPEGKMVKIAYRGPVKDTIQEILGGIRSTCTYVGARQLKDLSKCTTFIRVNNQLNEVFGSV